MSKTSGEASLNSEGRQVVDDFYSESDRCESPNKFKHIMDDEELDFSYSGTTRFEGMEAAGDLVCDPRSLREGYLRAVHEFTDSLRRECARQVVDYQTIRTSQHLDAALAHYVANRIGVHRTA